MSQFFVDSNAVPGGSINTLSAQGGAPTVPSGTNFDFSSATNGALLFATPSNGHMTAAVQVDGTTITVNGSNQLVSGASAFKWNNVAGVTQQMVAGNGYICTNPSLVTLTLPLTATPLVDIVKVVGYGTGSIRVSQQTGTQIELLDGTSTSGTGGYIQSASVEGSVMALICLSFLGGVYLWTQFEASQGSFTTN